MIKISQQVVEGGGVGKGGVLAGGGIQILLPAIGTEGGGVEGDQSSAAGLGSLHALNGRVDCLHRPLPASDQADHFRAASLGIIVCLPCLTDGGVIVDIGTVATEHQVCPR